MRHTGRTVNVPVRTVDGTLVAHHQRCNQAGLAALGHGRKNPVSYLLAKLLHRVLTGLCQPPRLGVKPAGSHVAGGLHALFPEPEFIVEAVRVAAAVRRLQAHPQLPAFAGTQDLGLALQLGLPIQTNAKPAVPAQIQQGWQRQWRTVQAGGFHRQPKAQTGLRTLRHASHQAHQVNVPPFQGGRQGLGLEQAGARPGEPEPDQRTHSHSHPQPTSWRSVFESKKRPADKGQGQ